MEIPLIMLGAGALIFLSHLFSHLFSKFQIPDVLLLVVIGLILGPITGIVNVSEFGVAAEVFVTLALLIILFEAGLGIKFRGLLAVVPRALLLVLLTFAVTVAVTLPVGYYLLGISVIESVLVGVLLGGISTGIIVPLLDKLPVSAQTRSLLTFEANLNDIVTVAIVFAILDFSNSGIFSISAFSTTLGTSILIALVVGLVTALAWSQVISKVRGIQDNIFMTPALVLVVFGITELLGASGIFAVFAFGITLGNLQFIKPHQFIKNIGFNEFRLTKWETRMFSGLVFILKTYFFVYIGLAIGFNNLTALMLGVAVTLVLFGLRALTIQGVMGKSVPAFDRQVLLRMMPKGLTAAAFITLIQNDVAQDFTYTVILSSIVITSVLIFLLPEEEEVEADQHPTSFSDAEVTSRSEEAGTPA